MRAPIDIRGSKRQRNVQANIGGKELGRKVALAENPQARQRAGYGTRCADYQERTGMREAADDGSANESAGIDDDKVE